jgi:hypothetical protein
MDLQLKSRAAVAALSVPILLQWVELRRSPSRLKGQLSQEWTRRRAPANSRRRPSAGIAIIGNAGPHSPA